MSDTFETVSASKYNHLRDRIDILKADLLRALAEGCDYCECTDKVCDALAKAGYPVSDDDHAEMRRIIKARG